MFKIASSKGREIYNFPTIFPNSLPGDNLPIVIYRAGVQQTMTSPLNEDPENRKLKCQQREGRPRMEFHSKGRVCAVWESMAKGWLSISGV